ncbi:MAG: S-ribosylhomocysteine lyase [Clostridia bacterium]|nr:S-ribosylhomocysteine lyase [Clostridia bacterium]
MDVNHFNRTPSFSPDCNVRNKGLYKNRHTQGVTVWDLQFKTPNADQYISPKAAHSIEHIIVKLLKDSDRKKDILYFGPMGSRTGFCLLTVNMEYYAVLDLLKGVFAQAKQCAAVPYIAQSECGNCSEHDLTDAVRECAAYLTVLEGL